MQLIYKLMGLDGADNEVLNIAVSDITQYAAKNGKFIYGYYGIPYIDAWFGDLKITLFPELVMSDGEPHLGLGGYFEADTNAKEPAKASIVWGGGVTGERLMRVPFVRSINNMSHVPINIINADVLPAYLPGDIISFAFCGIPYKIEYFAGTKEYVQSLTPDENGKRYVEPCGSMFPVNVTNSGNGPMQFDSAAFYAEIKNIAVKEFVFEDPEIEYTLRRQFICCEAITDFGPITIMHTYEEVPEDQRENIKVGAIVSFLGRLTGDVAINEYKNGFVKDYQNDFLLLRGVMNYGNPQRLRAALAGNVSYYFWEDNITAKGADDVIALIEKAPYCVDGEHIVVPATITEAFNGDKSLLLASSRCLIAQYSDLSISQTITGIKTGEDGEITEIISDRTQNYHVILDSPKTTGASMWTYITPEESVAAPIVEYAKQKGLIPANLTVKDVLTAGKYENVFEKIRNEYIEYVPGGKIPQKVGTSNLLGYLFAKAMETAHTGDAEKTEYSANDALKGIVLTKLDQKRQKKLEEALNTGGEFFDIYRAYRDEIEKDGIYDWTAIRDILIAMNTVQNLGAIYGQAYLSDGGDILPVS